VVAAALALAQPSHQTVTPRASMIASVQPSLQDASNSSTRRRSA